MAGPSFAASGYCEMRHQAPGSSWSLRLQSLWSLRSLLASRSTLCRSSSLWMGSFTLKQTWAYPLMFLSSHWARFIFGCRRTLLLALLGTLCDAHALAAPVAPTEWPLSACGTSCKQQTISPVQLGWSLQHPHWCLPRTLRCYQRALLLVSCF